MLKKVLKRTFVALIVGSVLYSLGVGIWVQRQAGFIHMVRQEGGTVLVEPYFDWRHPLRTDTRQPSPHETFGNPVTVDVSYLSVAAAQIAGRFGSVHEVLHVDQPSDPLIAYLKERKRRGTLGTLKTVLCFAPKPDRNVLELLAEAPHLESFVHPGCEVNESFASVFAQMQSLRVLSLPDSDIDSSFFVQLAKSPSSQTLQDLNLASCTFHGGAELDLESLRNLEVLNLKNTAVDAKSFEGVDRWACPLTRLDLRKTAVDDKVMELLADSPVRNTLQRLLLNETNTTDRGCSHLAKLTALNELSLKRCRITDDGVAQLKGLNLSSLTLSRTQVTKKGLATIARLEISKVVYAEDVGVSKDEAKQLTKEFPGTTFDLGFDYMMMGEWPEP